MKVTFYYERPECLTVEMNPPADLEGDALMEWLLDNSPAQEVWAEDFDYCD